MMDASSCLLSLSNLMLKCEGFQKHEARLPATFLDAQLLYASALGVSPSKSDNSSLGDGEYPQNLLDDADADDDILSVLDRDYLHKKLDNVSTVSFEDSPPHITSEDVLGIVESVGPEESLKRILLRTLLDIPRKPNYCIDFDPLPESTRDHRHVGDRCWHKYHHMSEVSETALPPMRYTHCDPSIGPRCFHEPSPVLQIFNMKLRSSSSDIINPIEVYGVVAVRDGVDYCRNYLFNRSRDNPLAINPTSDYLRLMSPKRAMSLRFNCLIEVDIRVKTTGDGAEDKTVVDGCMELFDDRVSFNTLFRCTMVGPYGIAIFDMIMFQFGAEATIRLDFLRVPPDGFDVQMCGYTSVQKNTYSFIDKCCECDSFVSSTGRFPQYFVAAVEMEDMLHIDFVEGRQPVVFKPAIHGSQAKDYHFHNGAIVSVNVTWSTTFY